MRLTIEELLRSVRWTLGATLGTQTLTASLVGPWYWIVLAFFPLVGTVFAVIRLPKEVARLADFASTDTVRTRVKGTPAETLLVSGRSPKSGVDLSRRQWGNIGLVVLFSQGVQVLLVIAMVFVVLVIFGLIVGTKPIVTGFLGYPPNVLAHVDLWDRHMVLTEELLRECARKVLGTTSLPYQGETIELGNRCGYVRRGEGTYASTCYPAAF